MDPIRNRDSLHPIEGRPLIFGEALFDWFPDGQRVLGGAPFNVAWHLEGFGCNPLMISRLGADDPGEEILDQMAGWGMTTAGMQRDDRHPTGRVTVKLADGAPSFDIEAQQAYDDIAAGEAQEAVADEVIGLLYHGTLALREAASWGALRTLIEGLSVPRICDLNLREPWWTMDRVVWCLRGSEWVKLNEAELQTLAERETGSAEACEAAARALAQEHGIANMVVTRGAAGALLVADHGRTVAAETAPQVSRLVDTVGAGDAFSAVVIVGMLQRWDPARLMQRAVKFAADLCAVPGATTGDVGLYRRHLDEWEHDGGA